MTVLSKSLRRLRQAAHSGRSGGGLQGTQLPKRLDALWQGLSSLSEPVQIVSGQMLVPGVTFWLDDEEGQQSLLCQGARGGGVTIRATVETPGRWMGLHFALGEATLTEQVLLGVYSQQRAARACSWRLCLRSGTPDGFVDHFFEQHVVGFAAPSQHTDLLKLAEQTTLPRQNSWRELVLFFHPESFEATVQDLRLFVA